MGTPMNEDQNTSERADSPASSDSSSSEEFKPISISTRLLELASIDANIATLLTESALAIDALNPVRAITGTLSRRDTYATHTDRFLEVLETIAAKLKRSIRGLEEDEVAVNAVHVRSGVRQDSAYQALLGEFISRHNKTKVSN